MSYKKKLIEVALPLKSINDACQHEKSVPRKGHPATLHLYWARRPLAVARAVIFSTIIDDPSNNPNLTEAEIEKERNRLFKILEDLVKWENTNNEKLIDNVNKEFFKTNLSPIKILDPFCGGGTIPLEAIRLGLEGYGSDINPLAVLITKTLIDYPFNFVNRSPINPIANTRFDKQANWKGYQGLADDVKYFGSKLNEIVYHRIKQFYPRVTLNSGEGQATLSILGWIWANTVKCPNPSCKNDIPLIKSFELAKREKKSVIIQPVINRTNGKIDYKLSSKSKNFIVGTLLNNSAVCLFCENSVPISYLRKQCEEGNHGRHLISIIAEGKNGRIYLEPSQEQIKIADSATTKFKLDEEIPKEYRVRNYGVKTFTNLFTTRQLLSLSEFSSALKEIHNIVIDDAIKQGWKDDKISLEKGGSSATAYADLISIYLAFAIDKLADWSSKSCSWINSIEGIRNTFSRHSVSFAWDYIEINPFSESAGNFKNHIQWISAGIRDIIKRPKLRGFAESKDVSREILPIIKPIVITDPPYYDNIFYADMSDFFYVWLKNSLKSYFPTLFSTIVTPKEREIVANPRRFKGGKRKAEEHFLNGLFSAATLISNSANQEYPIVYFYAYKQSESDVEGGKHSTGWETFLEGLLRSGHIITATWPIRTERTGRTVSIGKNALASSIVVTVRKRAISARVASRKEFIQDLQNKLPYSIKDIIKSEIAPVDLQQSAIGPGMAIFSSYSKILEADGSAMSVKTALQLINLELDKIQENLDIEMDSDTRFCIQWFSTYGFEEKAFGEAEVLAKAKDISVDGLIQAGVFEASKGKAKIIKLENLPANWDPREDPRVTLWECTHQLIRQLIYGEGQLGAAKLAHLIGVQKSDEAKELSYLLYHIADKNKWYQLANQYNTLITNWSEIKSLSKELPEQKELFGE